MKILAFAPHSAIWQHAFPEALVAEALKQEGHEILYVSCGGEFKGYCIPMSAYGVSANASESEKQKVCDRCTAYKNIIRSKFGFGGPDVNDILQAEDRLMVIDVLKGVNRHNFLDLELDGIPVARYALYEFLINLKKDSTVITEDEWTRFLPELSNALSSFYACKRLIDRELPDRVMVYNAFYSVNHICCELAAQRGIPHYFIHAGNNIANRMQTLFVTRGYSLASWNRNPHWKQYEGMPCTKSQLSTVTDHVLALLKGLDAFAYSAPAANKKIDLREKFGVRKGQKVLIATMSSSDERVAAEAIGVQFPDTTCIFPTQVEWIQALIDYAKQHQELCFIVRVHPRNFPNKRESVKSAQAEILEKILTNLPNNFRVNWPADAISLYDLAEIGDVILNGWSNAGKEMSLLGLPVVLYSAELVTSYPSSINYVGASLDDYFRKIEQALADGWSFENIRRAYRWCAFEYSRSLIDISESYPASREHGFSFAERVIRRIVREVAPYRQQLIDCKRRAKTLSAKNLINKIYTNASDSLFDEIDPDSLEKISIDRETAYLKQEIGRLLKGLYGDLQSIPSGGLGEKLKKVT
ncbi:hypothetical protein FHW67_002274 [Herbaspirillum sp. Sphag1AN]|uniref:hypothetical protein n=1 Tax=unclassified Herbaspirillum TaxID=2624150 RepID=UPI00161E2700|nr:MULTISPECIES: hypothetical protein [unclassified Herbaspirillum]MBB3212986.1 hypothetical protein [Herbaspirillum sp. Sphag1AN]MBB3246183.1 hypothetical protein [Herbaspirillum sp. Sphag64]